MATLEQRPMNRLDDGRRRGVGRGSAAVGHPFENLALADVARIAAVPAIAAIKYGGVDREAVAARQVGQREAQVRRLERAGVLIRRRDVDAADGDNRAALAAASGTGTCPPEDDE